MGLDNDDDNFFYQYDVPMGLNNDDNFIYQYDVPMGLYDDNDLFTNISFLRDKINN